jgi:signal peptidase I
MSAGRTAREGRRVKLSGSTDKPKAGPKVEDEASWWETAKIVFHALLIAMFIRLFLYQPFNIPSGSMKSTLLVGDYLFVSKLSYGYSRHSFFFGWPPFAGRVFGSDPKRGDVMVFKVTQRGELVDYIKRLVGMPGDEIVVRNSIVYVNGKELPRKAVGTFDDVDEDGRTTVRDAFEETMPDTGRTYTVLQSKRGPASPPDNAGPFKVPAGHFFMMGDNRDNSLDSRFSVGFVPFDRLVGRADIIFFSTDTSCFYDPDRNVVVQKVISIGCSLSTGIRLRRFLKLVR